MAKRSDEAVDDVTRLLRNKRFQAEMILINGWRRLERQYEAEEALAASRGYAYSHVKERHVLARMIRQEAEFAARMVESASSDQVAEHCTRATDCLVQAVELYRDGGSCAHFPSTTRERKRWSSFWRCMSRIAEIVTLGLASAVAVCVVAPTNLENDGTIYALVASAIGTGFLSYRLKAAYYRE